MFKKPTIIILCGGRGERLKPLTNATPKPLIKIKNKPIVSHLIDFLINQKFNKFILATGYKSKLIKKFIKFKYKKNNIKFVYSKKATIIQRIQKSIVKAKESVIVCYADTLADINFSQYLKIISKTKAQTMMTIYQPESKFGVIKCGKNNLIKKFEEKPTLSDWINIGYIYIDKSQFSKILKYKDFVLYIKRQVKKNKLLYFKHKKLHITINSITELEEAKKNIHYFK